MPLNRAPYLLTPTELAENDGLKLGPSIIVENGENVAPTTAAIFDQGNGGKNATTASTSASGLEIPRCDRSDFKLYHVVPLLPNGWGGWLARLPNGFPLAPPVFDMWRTHTRQAMALAALRQAATPHLQRYRYRARWARTLVLALWMLAANQQAT